MALVISFMFHASTLLNAGCVALPPDSIGSRSTNKYYKRRPGSDATTETFLR
jgi:hypothetical protein